MDGSPVILVNLPPEIPPAIQASLMKNNAPVLLNPVGHHWVAPKVGIKRIQAIGGDGQRLETTEIRPVNDQSRSHEENDELSQLLCYTTPGEFKQERGRPSKLTFKRIGDIAIAIRYASSLAAAEVGLHPGPC